MPEMPRPTTCDTGTSSVLSFAVNVLTFSENAAPNTRENGHPRLRSKSSLWVISGGVQRSKRLPSVRCYTYQILIVNEAHCAWPPLGAAPHVASRHQGDGAGPRNVLRGLLITPLRSRTVDGSRRPPEGVRCCARNTPQALCSSWQKAASLVCDAQIKQGRYAKH